MYALVWCAKYCYLEISCNLHSFLHIAECSEGMGGGMAIHSSKFIAIVVLVQIQPRSSHM